MTVALVLAAGRSARMGRPKPLLIHPLRGITFVRHLVECAREGGADRVLVVGRPGQEGLEREVAEAGAEFILNQDADQGQLSSLLAGLRAAQDPDAVLLMPVDVPLISPAVVAELLRAAAESPLPIVRAVHDGRHGHPVLFKNALFDELRRTDPSAGARAVVRADPSRVLDVEVGDAGVTEDLDTPEDYERVFGRKL